MGDYSRDSFQLTNVLHEYISGETVTNPKHYVGVKMQQGVPVLDADWNDADDIRRFEVELLLRDVIGNGVPGVGSGFAIEPVEGDNDFAIMPGMLIVDGWQVINPAMQLYSALPRLEGSGPDFDTPGGERTDIVYLDVFEQEVTAYGETTDERLVNEYIGIETAARKERSWTVRVAVDESDYDSLTLNESGHKYYPLAKLRRSSSARIEASMIEDLRRLGLTLADSIKSPMYIKRGEEELNAERFSQMLTGLRNIIKTWQQNELFPVSISTVQEVLLYQNATNEIYYLTTSAEVNSDTNNLDNADGLVLMQKLVDAQHELVNVIDTLGTGVPEEMSIIETYRDYLDGDDGNDVDGIQPAIDDEDLLGAVIAQEALTNVLGLSTGDLPQGSVTVIVSNVSPSSSITTDPFEITYTITSNLLVPETAEQFDLEAVVSDVRWSPSLSVSNVSLEPGESTDVVLTIDPADDLVAGDFADINLVATAHRRSSIKSEQPAQRYTIDELPVGETFMFYSGGVALTDGVLVLAAADIGTELYDVVFTLVNDSGGSETQFFDIEYELQWPDTLPDGVDSSQWQPVGIFTNENIEVGSAEEQTNVSFIPQDLTGVMESVEFDLEVTATLVGIDEATVTGGKSMTTLLPVRVTVS